MDSAGDRAAPELPLPVNDPGLLRLYEYWLARKGARRLPSRRDIDPLDFPYLLGNIMLLDVVREPLRFRVRLHGTEMARRAAYDLTGKMLDELPISDYRSYVIQRCASVVESREPAFVEHDRVLDGRRRRYQALWLPLSEDGETVSMLLCALVYQDVRW
jgi:hypothetical protein